MHLYGQMDNIAETEKEAGALQQLPDGDLKEQCLRRASQVWVQRELRQLLCPSRKITLPV